jgi:hypothetical protein
MFIGSNYVLTDSAEGRTSLGWSRIKVMERVLSRTEERVLFTGTGDPPGGGTKTVTSYCYTLMCLVDGGDSAEIDQDEFQNEVIAGYYQLTPEVVT